MPRPKKKKTPEPARAPGKSRRRTGEVPSLRFSRVNGALAGVGVISLVLGYWLLAEGSITLAPLLLVLGYVVLLPLALIL